MRFHQSYQTFCVEQCGTVQQYNATYCNLLQYNAPYCNLLRNIILHSTLPHCFALNCGSRVGRNYLTGQWEVTWQLQVVGIQGSEYFNFHCKGLTSGRFNPTDSLLLIQLIIKQLQFHTAQYKCRPFFFFIITLYYAV